MSSDLVTQITGQSQHELRPIVREILGENVTSIDDVTARKIGRSVGYATIGIFHVTGRAKMAAAETSWSAVVKALGQPENRNAGRMDHAQREIEVYRSRVFAEVCGGMRAAQCYTIQPSEDVQLLWLEDLSHAPQVPWEPEHYISAARNQGQFNAYWPDDALPTWPWLTRDSVRTKFTDSPGYQEVFAHLPQNLNHPLIHSLLSLVSFEQLLDLWQTCDELLARVERGPIGICHCDCHPKNLFPIIDAEGQSYTVGIDWALVGVANLGVDIGHLLGSPMSWQELQLDQAIALRDPLFDAYVLGLGDSGWSGNTDEVRLAYLTRIACEAIRETTLITNAIEREGWREILHRLVGYPAEELAVRFAANLKFFVDCLAEARRLAHRI